MRLRTVLVAGMLAAGGGAGCVSEGDARSDPPAAAPDAGKAKRADTIILPNIGKLPDLARPVLDWLRAVKTRDTALIARVFSSRVRRELAGRPWREVVIGYERMWQGKFGDWEVADFLIEGTVQTADDRNRGLVLVVFEPSGRPPSRTKVPVVREGDRWYVDENYLPTPRP